MNRGYTLVESLLVLIVLVGVMSLSLSAVPKKVLFELEHKRLVGMIEHVALYAQTHKQTASLDIASNIVTTSINAKRIRLRLRCTSTHIAFTKQGTITAPVAIQCFGYNHHKSFGYSLGSGQYYE
ncbi:MAG: hypothetical protein ACRDBX_00210 [Erysipelotrichaceae bacterium]